MINIVCCLLVLVVCYVKTNVIGITQDTLCNTGRLSGTTTENKRMLNYLECKERQTGMKKTKIILFISVEYITSLNQSITVRGSR